MAKVVKKDSDTYLKEKESFLRELQHFHETRGTPCRHSPKIGGKEIDLYLLYCLVTSNGGWVKVNSRNQWNSLLKEFHLPKNCVNVSVALKQIYLRYLDKYEKAHYLGETHNTLEDDEDTTGGGRHKRWSSARSTQPSVPLAYNHSQHQITESVRAASALSKDLYTPSEYDRLALSLLCPLPNEQDFALNVCTLLSNEFRAAQGTPTGIRLGRHTRLLRYLLAHAGVFADDTLRAYYADNYRDVRRHSLEAFWEDAIQDRAVLRLVRDMAAESDERAQQKRSRAREKRRREMEDTSAPTSEREENDVKDESVGSVAAASSSREGNVKDEPVGSVAASSTKKEDVKASDVGTDGTIEPGKDGMLEPSKKEEEKSDVSDKDDGRPTDSSEEVDKTLDGSNKTEDKQDASSDKESTAVDKEVKSSTATNEVVKSSTATNEVVKSSTATNEVVKSSTVASEAVKSPTATDKEVKSDADAAPCKSPKEQSAAKMCSGGDTDVQSCGSKEVQSSGSREVQSSGSKEVQSSGSKEVSEGASKEEEATAMDVCEGGSKEDDSNKGKSESSSMDVCEESSKEETTRLDDASKGGKSESSPMEVCCEGSSKEEEEEPCKDASKASEVSTACVQRSEKSSKDELCEGPDASKGSTACVQRSEKSSKDDLCEGVSKEQSKDASSSSEEEEEGVGKVSDDDVEFLSDSEDLGLRGAKRLKLRLEPEDRALFALGRGLGTQEWVGQRVLQIATLLRNFTFNEENNALLSRDPTFLRFMVLCCSSNWAGLRQLGLDMFSNVALEIRLDAGAAGLAPLLLDIVSRGLASEDRASVLACVEILSRLGQAERNEEVLLRSLQQNVYNQVCTLLTLHDIMLLIHTLECVYSLSSLGERACNAIMRVHGAMDVLVSLVTVEAQSFGPKACILMRVVETVDPNPASTEEDDTPADAPPPPPPGPPTGLNAPAFSMPMALAPVAVPVPLSQAVPPPAHGSPSPMTPMRHRPPLGATPTRVPVAQTSGGPQGTPRPMYRVMTPNKVHTTAAGTSASPVAAPGTSSGGTGAPVAAAAGSRPLEENGEMFATQWLRANFEHASLPGRAIEQAELYKQYINAASRAGRRGVIAPLHFPRVVRSVFGAQIGPKQVIPAAPPGSTAPPPPPIHVYEGIQVRGKQPIITQTIAIAAPPSHQQQQHQHLAQQQQNLVQKQQHLVQQQNLQQQQLVQQQQNLVQHQQQQQQNFAQQQQQNQQNLTQQSQQNLAQQQQQNLAQQHQNQQMLSQKQQQQQNLSQQQQNLSQQQQSLLSHQQHSQQQTTFLQNPMSPILKAQLSAPPKPQGGGGGGSAGAPGGQSAPAPTPGCSNTARTKAHPHLSQALLGAGTSTSSNTSHLAPSTSLGGASTSTGDPTCTSLIKSLLANKVGPSESLVASSSSSSCVSSSTTQPLGVVNTAVASQVTQRQQQAQKMLSQAQASTVPSPSTLSPSSNVPGPGTVPGTGSVSAPGVVRSPGPVLQQQQQMRLNGVTVNMQQVANHVIENSLESKAVSEGGAGDPPSSGNTPPLLASQPPPLAPLSSKGEEGGAPAPPGLVDGTSVVVNGGISNSINVLADTSDQQYKENIAKQSLMLVDLLEKSIGDKDTPILNGAVRIGEKGLDLFTSIETKSKLAAQGLCPAQGGPHTPLNTPNNTPTTPSNTAPTSTPSNNGGAPPTHVHSSSSSSGGVIRRVSSELESQQHRANGTSAPPATALLLNGAEQQQVSTGLKRPRSQDPQDSSEAPALKKVHHVNGDVNPACINLEEEQEENNVKASSTAANLYAALAADVLEDEELITEPPAPTGVQVPASQAHSTGVQQSPGAPSQAPQGVLSGGPPSQQSQGAQSQNIIMTGGGGGGGANGRQILVTGGQGGSLPQRLSMMGQHYVVTQQPQLVQGHPGQTVLVAQTGQQGGAGSKTIIILQPSSSSPSSSPHSSTTSPKPSVTSIAPSSSSTYTSTSSHQKVITSAAHPTSVLHRASSIRPQTSATVIKPVPDTRPRSSLAQPSGFQAQFIQQTQQQQQQQQGKLSQQQAQQQQPVQQQQPPQQQQQQQQPPAGQFICEWRGCMRNFKSANEVYMHACQSHCPVTPAAEIQCLWERCDVLRRKRFSHMTHLYDRHCNPDVLKMMAVRRKQLTSSGKTEIPPPPSPSPHPGYAPNAALNAIKRHALEFVNPKELQQRVVKPQEATPRPFEQDDNEGPVTKSIRLTSSLILRNLVIYSNTGRRHLVSYEPHLASVALSNVESSKTIAQVLFDMNDTQSRR